jgi:NADPH-dependent 7-cyano-7-deazaguanine reductase QueF-like protein
MFVCIHTDKIIDHANELTDQELADQWPLYELECVNRGFPWVAYKGDVPYTFPEVNDE